ncbi:MAG: aminotransferase class I/II-fold pyridoxal phosphate-dependent enzyme [Leptospirales bacterium]|nr:aminotransferase class I/II-fold pyridoxal phosphate-dependent enzyme [Leptospirales bacterium]
MEPVEFARAHIRSMQSYTPGLQINSPDVIKLNSNENPFPPSPAVLQALHNAIDHDHLEKYPDPRSSALRKRLAEVYGQQAERCIVTNGSDEGLSLLFRTVLEPGNAMLSARPSYSLYPILAAMQQARHIEAPLGEDWRMDFVALRQLSREARLTILANPNAPTGIAEDREALLDFAGQNPGLTLIDEAYVAFGGQSCAAFAGTESYPRLLVMNTFSKWASLAGQRIGWMFSHASLNQQFDKLRDSYNVSRLGQAAALAALNDEAEQSRRLHAIRENRDRFVSELASLGFDTLPSSANFVFSEPPDSMRSGLLSALQVRGAAAPPEASCAELILLLLRTEDILVRYFREAPCQKRIRISIGTWPQMDRILRLLYSLSRN